MRQVHCTGGCNEASRAGASFRRFSGKVTDAMQFAVVGVLVTPALAVDGKVLVSGRVPSKDEITKFFRKLFRLILPGRNPAVVPGQQNLRYLKKMVPSRKRHPLAAGAVAAVKHSKGVPDGKRL